MKSKKRIYLSSPNLMSIIWILICIKVVIPSEMAISSFPHYLIMALVIVATIMRISLGMVLDNREESILFLLFSALILLQFLGLLQVSTAFSFRNILATICVYCFVDSLAFHIERIQIDYLRIPFFIAIVLVAIEALLNVNKGNFTPGCVVFLSASYVAAEYSVLPIEKGEVANSLYKQVERVAFLRGTIIILLTAIICLLYDSRTSLLSLAVIAIVFLVLRYKKNISVVKLDVAFWLVILILLTLCVIYANVRQYGWYERINAYSWLYFNKNLDTSRPVLWKSSFMSLSWWQRIVGAGTGKLPDIERYKNSSFHNTYLQLIMQNGIVGLVCLILIFWVLWKCITKHYNDTAQIVVLSTFIGVLVYNCFEVTLIQNKTFLGMIQWLVISIGMIRSHGLELAKTQDTE